MDQKHFESLYPENVWDQVLNQVVDYIKEGNSSQLIGLPGVGRSSIFGLLVYNREVRLRHFPKNHGIVHFILVNFSEIKRRPYSDVVKFLFLCLGNSLREREMHEEYEKVDSLFKDALSYNDELVFTQGLKNAVDYLAIEKKLTVVFLFDRFDEYVPQVSEDFFTLLRSLRDRAKYRFSAIFSLSRSLGDTIEPQLMTDFSDFISGHTIYMPLSDAPSVEFRLSYLEKLTGKVIAKEQKEELLELTAGHIRLIKVSAEAVLASYEEFILRASEASREANSSQLRSNNTLEQFLLAQKTVQAALLSIWKSLTPEEQASFIDVIPANAGIKEGNKILGQARLAEAVAKRAENDETTPRGYLERVGLMQEGRVTIPLFAKAITDHLFKENEAKFTYDEGTNVIKKGEITISDGLTKAEFRLLRHLLQHQEEIIDREVLIGVVWQEEKTTAGVTEQAVDQLLFRLRRKIEEDPNNPLHLQTVKGRGVRFTA